MESVINAKIYIAGNQLHISVSTWWVFVNP